MISDLPHPLLVKLGTTDEAILKLKKDAQDNDLNKLDVRSDFLESNEDGDPDANFTDTRTKPSNFPKSDLKAQLKKNKSENFFMPADQSG
jgi:hypothetical protein